MQSVNSHRYPWLFPFFQFPKKKAIPGHKQALIHTPFGSTDEFALRQKIHVLENQHGPCPPSSPQTDEIFTEVSPLFILAQLCKFCAKYFFEVKKAPIIGLNYWKKSLQLFETMSLSAQPTLKAVFQKRVCELYLNLFELEEKKLVFLSPTEKVILAVNSLATVNDFLAVKSTPTLLHLKFLSLKYLYDFGEEPIPLLDFLKTYLENTSETSSPQFYAYFHTYLSISKKINGQESVNNWMKNFFKRSFRSSDNLCELTAISSSLDTLFSPIQGPLPLLLKR